MSFALEVKEEIVKHDFSDPLAKAFLAGFIKYNMKLLIINSRDAFEISSISNSVIRQLYSLLKKNYHYPIQVIVTHSEKFKFHKNFTLRITTGASEILTNLQVYNFSQRKKILKMPNNWNEQQQRAYFAGIFVACGSVNSPCTSNYHLELQFNDEENAKYFIKKVKKFNFDFKIIKRFDKYVCYIKKSIFVSDFLKLIDAVDSVLKFEDTRISRDLTNSINRLNNIEISNQQKISKAGEEQIKMIKYLQDINVFDNFSNNLKNLLYLRLDHHDSSLTDLAELYSQYYQVKISKSGVNHLFRKLRNEYWYYVNANQE